MSIHYLSWAMGTDGPRLTARLVIFVLGDATQDHHFAEDGPVWPAVCWPSVDWIAKKARVSRRQAFEALKSLEEGGFIRTVPAAVHGLEVHGRPVDTPIRQLEGGCGFRTLPCEAGGAELRDGGGVENRTQTVNSNGNGEELRSSPLSSSEIENGGDSNGERPAAGPIDYERLAGDMQREKYAEPKTKGAAAAPWLVLELARLMRVNDPAAKLPVALRGEELRSAHTVASGQTLLEAARAALDLGHPSLKGWLDAMRLLIDTDKREPREVVQVLRWCQGDEFWHTNILSATKFRDKYPGLRLRALEARPAATGADAGAQLDALARR